MTDTAWDDHNLVGDRGGNGPRGPRGADSRDIPGGRLTLVTGNPVTRSDISAGSAQTIYYTPYMSSQILLYDTVASTWRFWLCPEISASLAGLTTAQPYDVFVYSNTGTLTLELVAWSSNSARATAITLQDGIYVKSGDASRRFVGTLQMQATGQCEDSVLRRYVFNFYNRVPRQLRRADPNASWIYTTATWRQANAAVAGTANQVSVVNGSISGNGEMMVHLNLVVTAGAAGTGPPYAVHEVAFGVDSTTTVHADSVFAGLTGGVEAPVIAVMDHFPDIGKHDFVWLEKNNTTPSGGGNMVWIGTGSLTSGAVSGITGHVMI